MMFGWYHPWGFWMGGTVMMGIGLIVMIAFLYFMFRAFRGFGPMNGNNSFHNSLEILKERYARGEIDQETYNRMKNELK
ncbi:hypothetical protein D2Q93_08740 [Alicyclobacillaceae bacterium I2511]|nr:hypothetical protein D2Q93_08740 [Alicyclobacillaceae bacterium I2511]